MVSRAGTKLRNSWRFISGRTKMDDILDEIEEEILKRLGINEYSKKYGVPCISGRHEYQERSELLYDISSYLTDSKLQKIELAVDTVKRDDIEGVHYILQWWLLIEDKGSLVRAIDIENKENHL